MKSSAYSYKQFFRKYFEDSCKVCSYNYYIFFFKDFLTNSYRKHTRTSSCLALDISAGFYSEIYLSVLFNRTIDFFGFFSTDCMQKPSRECNFSRRFFLKYSRRKLRNIVEGNFLLPVFILETFNMASSFVA